MSGTAKRKHKRRVPDGGHRPKAGIGLFTPEYSEKKLTCISKAAGLPLEAVARHKLRIEAIALQYRIDTGGPTLIAPSTAIRKLGLTAQAARRLLRHMGVNHRDVGKAADGHHVSTIFDALASVDTEQEEAIEDATGRIARLVEILEAAAAARGIERVATEVEADSGAIREISGATGHTGDLALNNWIGAMMALYEEITGKTPSAAYLFSSREAGGPLIRFLQAAAKPLRIDVTPDSLRSRIHQNARIGGLQE